MLFQDEASGVLGRKIFMSEPNELKELEHALSKKMRVPHDIHVTHEIDPVCRNHNGSQNRQGIPIVGCQLKHNELSSRKGFAHCCRG